RNSKFEFKEPWTPLTRTAFRFSFVYLGLFCVASQIAGSLFLLPGVGFRGFGLIWPMRQITFSVAQRFFGVTDPVYISGKGEMLFFWVQALWLLVLSIAATVVWSVLDRKRYEYATLHKWFR